MAGVKDNIAWKQNANWHGQICKMQKGKKGREEKKKGQKDKTSVMGGDKIGKKWKVRSARWTTGKQIAFCYGFFAAWEQLIFL